VSVLEALASLADRDGKIAAAMDAGRKEVFLGLYERSAENSAHAIANAARGVVDAAGFLATLGRERPP